MMEKFQQFNTRQINRYQYIIENVRDVVWEMNKDHVITFMTPNSIEMCGYRADEIIGRKITDFLTDESNEYFGYLIATRLHGPINGEVEKPLLHDVQFICKDGTIIWVQVTVKQLFEEGEFIGFIGTTRDIMESKEYEYQLHQYIEQLKKLNKELEKTAVTDTLTGIYNRRKFDEDLISIIGRQETRQDLFSLLLFDIDNFKSVNDGFGHETGDLVLRRISELVSTHIRKSDRFFRWGGEEFMIILYGSDLTNAKKVAEKIRNIIANEYFGIVKQITVSFGVGEYQEEENAEQLIARLDKLLYQAKVQGGNRVIG